MPRSEIDDLYLVRPYYIVPDGKVGHDAFAVIRETIRSLDKVALARVVLTNREHVIALEARDKGLTGMLLRYPYEVRDSSEYFDDIQDVKITKDMLDLAKHIVEQKSGHFDPEKFEDHYEAALQELLSKKQKGQPIAHARKSQPDNVVNLMDALRESLKTTGKNPAAAKTSKGAKKTAKPRRKAGFSLRPREFRLGVKVNGPVLRRRGRPFHERSDASSSPDVSAHRSDERLAAGNGHRSPRRIAGQRIGKHHVRGRKLGRLSSTLHRHLFPEVCDGLVGHG